MRAFKISEEKYIREHYGKTPIRLIAEHLGRRKSVVTSHIKLMGLQLTPEQRKARNPFKKNQPAHNKGKSGKPNKTSFKKGVKPKNAKNEGDTMIKRPVEGIPYMYIKIAGKWLLMHRYLWTQSYGPIPSGFVVRFKDGNTMNIELDNLELASKKQVLKRNYNASKASETLRHKHKVKKAIAKHRAEFPALFE